MKTRRISAKSHGGVHPAYRKSATTGAPVRIMPVPKNLFVSMSQHLGAPSKPLVKKGDAVLRGQKIAEPGGFVSVPVHAPTSGTIKAVEETLVVSGRTATVVSMEADGNDRLHESCRPPANWESLQPKELVQLVANAGMIGMGGAGFPSHVKLSPPPAKTIDTLIVNGAECEPYLTADERVMVEYADKVWKGAQMIRRILGVGRVRVAVEDNKPEAVAAMEKAMSGAEGDVEIDVLESMYPQGAEKQLIYSVTGREIPSGGLPMDVGVLVHNVGTAAAIHAAIAEGMPLIERVVTVTGDCVATPRNVLARMGTSVADLVAFCGGLKQQPAKVISGGPMMGIAIPSMDPGTAKTTSGILLLSGAFVEEFSSTPCISCGRCVGTCPMRLMPNELSLFMEAEDYEMAEEYDVMDCIECGSCAFECPAYRPLVQHMKQGKARVTAMRREREAKKAEAAAKAAAKPA